MDDNRQHPSTGVSPLAAVAIVLVGVALIGLKLWAGSVAGGVATPSALRATPDGRLAVLVGHHLYIGRPGAPDARVYDLARLDADTGLYEFDFFPDGDLLVWRTPGADTAALTASPGHLARCDLQTIQCERFIDDEESDGGEAPPAPSAVAIAADGTVYLADTVTNRVRAYTATGREQWRFTGRLAYPNGLWLDAGRLHVASTDVREIVVLAVSPEAGTEVGRHEIEIDGHRPIALAPVGAQWWVVAIGDRPVGTAVHRLGPDWIAHGTLALGEGAEPTALLPLDGRVYVADAGRFRVARFTPAGEPDGAVAWPALRQQLAEARSRHAQYTWIGHGAWVAFMGFVLAGCLIGYREGESTAGAVRGVPPSAIGLGPDSDAIHWLPRNPKFQFSRRGLILLEVLLGIMGLSTLAMVGLTPIALQMAAMCLGLGGLFWVMVTPLLASRVGVHDGWLLLDNGRRVVAGRGDAIIHTTDTLAIDDTAVPLGRSPQRIFNEPDLVEHVYPLLRRATKIPKGRMQLKMLRSYPTLAGSMAVLLFVGLAWVGFFSPVFRSAF